jgi:hypothetical protein
MRGVTVYVFQSDVHWSHRNIKLIQPRQEVEQVMCSQGQVCWLYIMGHETESLKGERGRQ